MSVNNCLYVTFYTDLRFNSCRTQPTYFFPTTYKFDPEIVSNPGPLVLHAIHTGNFWGFPWRDCEEALGGGMGSENPEQCSQEISHLICPCTKPSLSPSDQEFTVLGSSSALSSFEFESQTDHSTSVSSSDYDQIYQQIEQQFTPKRKSRRTDRFKRNREKKRKNACGARQACSCAAIFAADCAAVCCCPCVTLNLIILAFVKIPCAFAARASRFAKKKARIDRNSNHKDRDDDHGGGDEMKEKRNYYTPPW